MVYSRKRKSIATLRNKVKGILKAKDFGTRQALVLLKETFTNEYQRLYLIYQANELVGSKDDTGKILTFLDAVNVLIEQMVEQQKEIERGIKDGFVD